jgi:catechol 2,3-dioxygenase-like lactoylglutathione lyase family enzyme
LSLPGLRGVHHLGITVPDVEEAARFFVDVLGCEEVCSLSGVAGEGTWMTENLGVHPRAEVSEIRLLRCGSGANLELSEYVAPDQRTAVPGNADIGSCHLAFQVDDLPAAVDHLRANGVEIQGEPKLVDEGPRAGATWVYFRAPWGSQLELVTASSGAADELGAGTPLWSPAHPER